MNTTNAQYTAGPLAVGYYRPSERFRAIAEHVCAMREDQPGGGTPVAICGPSDDPQSHADAALFTVAGDLLAVARGLVAMVDGVYEENEDLLPNSPWFPLYSRARDAIAKAEG